MLVTPSWIITLFKLRHVRNVESPELVTLPQTVKLVRTPRYVSNALSPMFAFPGIVTLVRFSHPKKAFLAMQYTLSGIVTLVRLLQSSNIDSPM